jgi:hypothetical protein
MTIRKTRTRLKTQIGRFGGRAAPATPRIELDRSIVRENSPEDTEIGVLRVNNGSGDYAFTFESNSSEQFKLVPRISQVTDPIQQVPLTEAALRCGATVIDFEATPTIDITIAADNGVDPPLSRTFTITVTNVTVTLSALTLSGSSIEEASTEDTLIGEILGTTENSTLSLTDTAGGRFKITDGNLLTGATATDYSVATSHNITIRETHAEGTNSPLDTVLPISVIDAVAPSDAELYNKTIVVTSSSVATALGGALTDLRTYLGDMTGTTFQVSNTAVTPSIQLSLATAGDAPAGSVAALSGKGLDAFRLVGTNDILHIVANNASGISRGIYSYLEHLGMRWLMPNSKWTITPSVSDIRYVVNGVTQPPIQSRGYFGTGGFTSLVWGHSYAGSAAAAARVSAWQRRLRHGNEYTMGGHVYQVFLTTPSIATIMDANPTYLAKVDGVHVPFRNASGVINSGAKLNAGNAACVDLFATWCLGRMTANRATANVVSHRAVTAEPSDGANWGNNTAELVLAGVGDGSASDQAFHIANAVAVKIAATYSDGLVTHYAYNAHIRPPSFALEPNIVVQVIPYAYTGGLSPTTLISEWAVKADKIALYDYWALADWAWEQPVFNYNQVGENIEYWYASSIIGIGAESTYGAGAMGIGHYVAGHLFWDPTANDQVIIDEWFQLAFGTLAKVPMKRMMDRWASGFINISAEIVSSYADLTEARTLAVGDADATARILDYGRYLHYLRLQRDLANLTDPDLKTAKAYDIIEHVLEIDDSQMVHTSRIADLYRRIYPGIATEFQKTATITAPRWADVVTLTDADVQTLITQGAAEYASSPFSVADPYTGPLTRVTDSVWVEPTGDPWLGTSFAGGTDFKVLLPEGLERIDLRVDQHVSAKDITVTRESDSVVIFQTSLPKTSVATFADFAIDDDGTPLEPGVYTVNIAPAGGRNGSFACYFYRGLPYIIQSIFVPKPAPSPRLYFYVPVGHTSLAMWLELGDFNGSFGFKIMNPSGVAQTIQWFDGRTVAYVEVPTGQDGAVWSMEKLVSPNNSIRALTFPQCFSREPEALSVPLEALTGYDEPDFAVPTPIFQLDASVSGTFTQDGGKVAEWYDRQNPSRAVVNTNGTGSTRPVYSATAVGAKAGVTFVRTSSERLGQQVGFTATDLPTLAAESTIFWVWNTATTSTQKIFAYGRTATPYYGLRTVGIRNGNVDVGINFADHTTSTSAVGNHLACWGLNGTASSINVDGAAAVTKTLSNTPNTGAVTVGITVGSYNSASEFFNGTVQEIRVYDSILTTDERQYIEGELATKWGLLANLPSDHPYKDGI